MVGLEQSLTEQEGGVKEGTLKDFWIALTPGYGDYCIFRESGGKLFNIGFGVAWIANKYACYWMIYEAGRFFQDYIALHNQTGIF